MAIAGKGGEKQLTRRDGYVPGQLCLGGFFFRYVVFLHQRICP